MGRTSWAVGLGVAALGVLVGTSAGGCGGGGGDPVTIPLTASEDGYWGVTPAFVSSVLPADPSGIAVGDNEFGGTSIGYVRFDLSGVIAGLPAGARIRGATLTLTKVDVIGAPFTSIGTDHSIHLDHGLFSTPSVVAGDWSSLAPLGADVGLLVGGSDAAGAQTFTVDVLASVLVDISNGRTVSDYRLRFVTPTSANGTADFARFHAMEGVPGTGSPPILTVVVGP